jgi:ATP phosphoribosyltransferase/sugar/nucleoside kinase (ribokinase family)
VVSTVSVLGIDRANWDHVVAIPQRLAHEHLVRLGMPTAGVHRVEDHGQITTLLGALAPLAGVVRGAGGPVSNTIAAMGRAAGAAGSPVELHWLGTVGRGTDPSDLVSSPLDSLRRLSITPWSSGYRPEHCGTVCLIDAESRETFFILVQQVAPLGGELGPLERCDVVVVSLADLLSASAATLRSLLGGQRIALIAGDSVRLSAADHAVLDELARRDRVGWVFGQISELRTLGFGPEEGRLGRFPGAEVIGTQGTEPVSVWCAASPQPVHLEVPVLREYQGTDLGAGDAYAGGYLLGRLLGSSVAESHAGGVAASAIALATWLARDDRMDDLNTIISSRTDRESSHDHEGELFDRVRTTGGLTAVSGGQTGVDQIGLAVAAELGLPAFGVLPAGNRTDRTDGAAAGTDNFSGAYIAQLGSPSYRYRTWVTAYLGDGTLLWDFCDSEGSAAAKQACRTFGRPLLDLNRIAQPERLAAVRNWARQHDIRVINVAGNRASFLEPANFAAVHEEAAVLLRAVAFDRAQEQGAASAVQPVPQTDGPEPGAPGQRRPLRIGVSNAGAQRTLFAGFLAGRYGFPVPGFRELSARLRNPDLDVYYARASDLPDLLGAGLIDLGLFGSDVLVGRESEAEPVLRTGLFPLLVVSVMKADTVARPAPSGGWRFASQYGEKFLSYLGGQESARSFRKIGGTAETWLELGAVDVAVDTWKTGATAQENGMVLRDVLLGTSWIVAVNSRAPQLTGAARTFLDDLRAWLAGS